MTYLACGWWRDCGENQAKIILPQNFTIRYFTGILRTQTLTTPSVENLQLTNGLPLKPGVGQNIAMHASLTAKNYFPNFDLLDPFAFIFPTPLPVF